MTSNNIINYKEDANILEEQRQTFVASLGHDLKNPTIAQIRALELCLKGEFGKLAPNQKDIIEMVLDSCKYMYAMLGSLLVTYKNDNGTIKLQNDEVSISELAEECIEEMIYLAKFKGVKITVSNSVKNDVIYGDRIQIKRVIINLLSNGIKYAYKDTEIKIFIYNEGKFTYFTYENKSPYLQEKHRKAIFERYISYTKANSEFSIGLGLYASKKIVEAHDGKIFVKSNKNNTNTFGFGLPFDPKYRNITRFVTF